MKCACSNWRWPHCAPKAGHRSFNGEWLFVFKTGQAVLSAEGMAELAKARDYLRGHPELGVLALAYTDTRGGRAVNRTLAARRAQAVRSGLTAEGGIAASRVFVAELPETDLPTLTGRAIDSQSNRSVQLMLLALPPRGR